MPAEYAMNIGGASCGVYLFSLQRGNHIAQVAEAALDVIASLAFESVVMGALLCLIGAVIARVRVHIDVLTVDILDADVRTVEMVMELIEIEIERHAI